MKRLVFILLFAASAFAEDLPPAPKILAAARAQLPPYPVKMKGVLKQWAANGFMKKALDVDMTLDWNAVPAQAEYHISDPKREFTQTVKIFWKKSGVQFDFSENGVKKELNPFDQILGSGVTWIDLTFSFLWNQQAETIGTDKKLGKACYLISIPRPDGNKMRIWVEKDTGRLLGAEEYNANGDRLKIIKVVSVKKFDDLWMVKDLDIIQPGQGGRTSLRVDQVSAQSAPKPTAQTKDTRPNIIFILTDDQRYDALGFVGRFPWLKTPNLDRIRNEGVYFKNAFTTHSLCAPSRAGFLTGMHSHKNGITTNQEGREINHDKTPTFGQYLQRAGYDTGYIGKWHLGEFDDPRPGWNYWCSFKGQGNYDQNLLNIDGTHILKKGYVTDVLTDYAIDFIKREHDGPFLLYLSHKAVHQPFIPAERHKNQYAGLPAPEPLGWMDDMDDKPEWQRRIVLPPEQGMRLRRKHPLPVPAKRGLGKWPAATGTHEQRNYLRCISAVDEGIGRIFQTLEEKGLLENTVIAFAGDNGYMHGEHGLGDKRIAYNESMRIPLIMRGPGVEPGGTVDEIALNLDVAPTFLDFAGVKIPDAMQGHSLLPLAEGQSVKDWRHSFLFTYWRDLVTAIPRITAVRTLDKMYAHYPDGDSIDELYDLSRDPGEMQNLANRPEAKPLKEKMQHELDKVMAEAEYRAIVPRPHPENLEGRPLGVLVDENYGSGLRCSGEAVKTIAMNEKLDPHYGCLIYETTVTPQSDGIILSYGDKLSGYMFYVENGAPGFCFSSGNRFHALDGDNPCIGKRTHLLVMLDNYTAEARFFVNGKLVQTETIYCNLRGWIKRMGDITIGADPEPLVDPFELSKMGGFTGTVYSFKIQRNRMTDDALAAYAQAGADQD